ncbi:MAG: methyltransferase domain-containing protein [Dehalococcoidales bacterium]|nr:methyltransferase domain-containing protein [Dehalococcoidales bacterium]
MFKELEEINTRPEPFELYTASDLWTDKHTSKQMLSFHLNDEIDISSRNIAFIDKSVEWISSHFKIGAGKNVADFGCGPGLYTTRLAQKGAAITGIDFSTRSIQYARELADKERLSIKYVIQNYLEFETDDRYDLILMIMCDFCALSPSQRNRMLTIFHSLLKPGGFVLLDVFSLNAFEQRKETSLYEPNLLNRFWSPNKYYGFLNTFKYVREKVVLDKYTIIEANRTRIIYNWLQYFDPSELERELAESRFKVQSLYADVAGSPFDINNPEFAVAAWRA